MTSENNLRIDYESHPDFQSTQQCWPLDRDIVVQFNELYLLARSADATVDKLKFADLIDCIFASLSNGINNEFEIDFIDRLRMEVTRLTNEHIRFFTSFKSVPFSRTTDFSEIARYKTGTISKSTLEKIQRITQKSISQLSQKQYTGKVDRSSLSVNSGIMILRLRRLLNREFSNSKVLQFVDQSLPFKSKVTGVALELSTKDAGWWKHEGDDLTDPKTKYAHFDESIDSLKAIVYLSNVNIYNGPFSFYPTIFERLSFDPFQLLVGRCVGNVAYQMFRDTAMDIRATSSPTFRNLYMRLPREIRCNSHFGWDVVPNSTLESTMVNSEVVLTGETGTFIVFDGSHIVHRGGMVQEGMRLALQVVFGRKSLRDQILVFLRSTIKGFRKKITV